MLEELRRRNIDIPPSNENDSTATMEERLALARDIIAVHEDSEAKRRWFSVRYSGLDEGAPHTAEEVLQAIRARKAKLHPDKTKNIFHNDEDIALCENALKALNYCTDMCGRIMNQSAAPASSDASGPPESVHPRGEGPPPDRPRPEGPRGAYVWDPGHQHWRCRVCNGGGGKGTLATEAHLKCDKHLKRIWDEWYLNQSTVPVVL